MDRRTPQHRTRLASGLVLVGLLAATGCGNNGVSAAGGYVKPADAASASAAAAARHTLNGSDLFAKTYAAAVKAHTAHVTMTMTGALGSTSQGDVSYSADHPSMQMTMSQAGRRVETRLVDRVLYLQIPGVVPAGKFLAIDPRDTSSPIGKAFGGLTDQMDPMKSLQNLKGAITSVRVTGRQSIHGTPTTKYHVVVDTAKVLARLRTQLPQAAQNVPSSVAYDLWLDSHDLMRRMRFTMSTVTMQMDLTRWGQPVHITKPPASAIVKQPGA